MRRPWPALGRSATGKEKEIKKKKRKFTSLNMDNIKYVFVALYDLK